MYKSQWGSLDLNKIIITIVPSCTGENITRFVAVGIVTDNNTDGNKLVTFPSIAKLCATVIVV